MTPVSFPPDEMNVRYAFVKRQVCQDRFLESNPMVTSARRYSAVILGNSEVPNISLFFKHYPFSLLFSLLFSKNVKIRVVGGLTDVHFK